MNDNDFNEMLKKAQSMIQNNQIPDDIRALVNNLQNSNGSSSNGSYSGSANGSSAGSYNGSANGSSAGSYNCSANGSSVGSYNGSNNATSNGSFNRLNNSTINSSANVSNNANNTYGNNNYKNSDSNNNLNTSNIDMETLMKIQKIMSKMKNSSDDDMSKLLLSLKPYLRNGKKEKIDEYIQLIKMGKMTQLFDLFGGEKK